MHQGATVVHFQDFNAEVLQCLTIPNVDANLTEKSQPLATNMRKRNAEAEIRYFAGDWGEVHQILPHVHTDGKNPNCSPGLDQVAGYDIILMAETVYSISALPNLYELIKKVLFNLLLSFLLFISFSSWTLIFSLFTVHGSSLWSCVYGSKKALFWRRRGIKAVPICGGERW